MKFIYGAIAVIIFVCIGVYFFSGTTDGTGMMRHTAGASYDETVESLRERAAQQLETFGDSETFHSFSFSDHLKESGITFSGRIVPVERSAYGHGMALAAIDVGQDSITDVFFVSQVGGNQLWRNRGDGTFVNITDTVGANIAMPSSANIGAAVADFDNSGTDDLLVTTIREGVRLFRNSGETFADVTEAVGLGQVPGNLSGAFFFDYNNDGLLDIFISSIGGFTTEEKMGNGYYKPIDEANKLFRFPERAETPYLFRQRADGSFENVTAEVGITTGRHWSGDAAFGDIDRDGFQDLFILNMFAQSQLYLNKDGSRFSSATKSVLGTTPLGGMGAKFFDFNNDALVDLYVTDMHSDMLADQLAEQEKSLSQMPPGTLGPSKSGISGNAFYIGSEVLPLREESQELGTETYWPWGISVADVNADGFMDAFVTGGMGSPWRYGVNSMLLNEKGRRFIDSEFLLGIEPRTGGHLIPKREGSVEEQVVSSRSSIIFDIEGDGDLDIITSDLYNAPPQILVSNLSGKKSLHYLNVELEGTQSNTSGLGAVVTVKTDETSVTQYHDGKSGYLSQSALPLYFGLGDARAREVSVRWPSGIVQTIRSSIPQNGTLHIRESK